MVTLHVRTTEAVAWGRGGDWAVLILIRIYSRVALDPSRTTCAPRGAMRYRNCRWESDRTARNLSRSINDRSPCWCAVRSCWKDRVSLSFRRVQGNDEVWSCERVGTPVVVARSSAWIVMVLSVCAVVTVSRRTSRIQSHGWKHLRVEASNVPTVQQ